MATYKFVQGIDYGPRNGTLGIGFHMSEGYDGLPNYLARHTGEDLWEWANRVNGVSCNVAILSTGEKVQMVDWGHAAGNLNPEDRAGEYGYYGGSHLRAVLGTHWTNPNEYSLSAELAGFRAKGPTDAQVRAAIEWGLDMRQRFPSIRGSFGHHDQSPKPCPGLTPNMRAIFAGVGGHGLFTPQGDDVKFIQASGLIAAPSDRLLRLPEGTTLYGFDGAAVTKTASARDWPYVGLVDASGSQRVILAGTSRVYDDDVTRPTLLVAKTGTLVDAPVVAAVPKSYTVTVGGKAVGEVELP